MRQKNLIDFFSTSVNWCCFPVLTHFQLFSSFFPLDSAKNSRSLSTTSTTTATTAAPAASSSSSAYSQQSSSTSSAASARGGAGCSVSTLTPPISSSAAGTGQTALAANNTGNMAFDGGGSGSGGCALCSATAAAVSFTSGGRRVSHSATAELQSCRINGRCLCCAACCHPAMMMGNVNSAAAKAGRTVMAPMGVEIVDPSSPEDGSVVSSADSQRTVSPFVVGDGGDQGAATNGDMYSNGGGGGQGGGGGGGHHHHRRQMSMRMFGEYQFFAYIICFYSCPLDAHHSDNNNNQKCHHRHYH